MDRYQRDVYQLHADGVFTPDPPVGPTLDQYPAELRVRLMMEEVAEFADALGYFIDACTSSEAAPDIVAPICIRPLEQPRPDMAKAIDAIVDILYVTYGAAVAMGVDLDPFWCEVQRANASKKDGPIREDGKRLKPPGWTPPDIEGVLKRVLAVHTSRCPNPAALRRYNGIVLCESCCERSDVHCPDALPEKWKTDGRCMAVTYEG